MGNIFGREKVAADVQLAQDARELLPPSEEALDALQALGQRPPTPAATAAALSVDVPLSFDLGVQQTPLHSPAFSPLHSPAFSPQQQHTPAQTPQPFSPVSLQQQSPAVHTLSAVETLLSSQVMQMSSYLGNYISAFEEKRKAARVGGGRGVNRGHPPPISVSSITADNSHPEALERDFVAALKPLFKEWLELRDDYHDTLGGYLRLPAEEPERLLRRVRHLRKYLREQVPASSPGLPERLREFHVWLKDQVKEVESAIKRADPKRFGPNGSGAAGGGGPGSGGGGGGGGGGGPQSPKPPGPPQQKPPQQQTQQTSRKVYRAAAVATRPATSDKKGGDKRQKKT